MVRRDKEKLRQSALGHLEKEEERENANDQKYHHWGWSKWEDWKGSGDKVEPVVVRERSRDADNAEEPE